MNSFQGVSSGEIQSTSGKYRKKEYDLNEYTVKSKLTITNFGFDDVGVYKCICKNDMNILGDKVEGQISIKLKSSELNM